MIRIDGSHGEGGGQILRTAVALSCLTGDAVEVYNIRANRPKPGLAAQHLKGIEAAKLISNARVEGLKMGSTRIVFKPGSLRGGDYRIDIGTAGSVTLILQTILLPSLAAEKESVLQIIGGTDVNWSPPVDYVRNVTVRALEEMGAKVEIELIARGYYPKGGGRVSVKILPSKLRGVTFRRIDEVIRGISHCSNLPAHIARRQAESAANFLRTQGYNVEVGTEVRKDFSTGSGITLWSGYKGGSALGERGKRAEVVGLEAARILVDELRSEAAFDAHLADQIMPFAAVAKGVTEYSTSRITMHQRSNAYVIQQFLGDVVEISETETPTIKIKGQSIIS
jgi:RNA 3'-terminal phosphate cyclase (ATP)